MMGESVFGIAERGVAYIFYALVELTLQNYLSAATV